MTPAARLRRVAKRLGAVAALDGVDFDLAPGEIHGLLGENGAGKTTLARVLGGLVRPDAGRVEIQGRQVALRNAGDAGAVGVGMVHQHFSLVPRFSGIENVALFDRDAWTARGTLIPAYRDRVEARAQELGLEVALDVPVAELGVGARQRIEILKALMSETSVLLLDEPTAVLAPREVAGLFGVLRGVAAAGTGVVLVAHKLDEVLAVADRVTVLRRGRRVLTDAVAAVSAPALAEAMVGDALSGAAVPMLPGELDRAGKAAGGAAAADAAAGDATGGRFNMYVEHWNNYTPALREVTLEVRSGEIVGIAGVDGNGQRTLAAVLAGVRTPDEGAATLARNVGWIPQDRQEEGLVGQFSVTWNVAFALHDHPDYRTGPWFAWRKVKQAAAAVMRDMNVRTASPDIAAATLSGGNQQRIVVGREFLRSGELLVAESPTRGLDVKATVAVRKRIVELARTGERPPGVVLISADLDEILELADRVVVMVRGRLIEVAPGDHNRAAIGEMMLGAR